MKCRQVYIHRTVKLINLIMDEKQIKEWILNLIL
jgi:hypothetical protein